MNLFKWAKNLQEKLNNLVSEGREVTFKKVMDWDGVEELTLIQVFVDGVNIGTYEEFKMKFVFRNPNILFSQNVTVL